MGPARRTRALTGRAVVKSAIGYALPRMTRRNFLSTGRGGDVHATPEQAMLNLKTTYAIERAVATGQAVRLDQSGRS